MTRKQLVEGLRVLHEGDEILEIKYNHRRRCVNVWYITAKDKREGQLLIAYATEQRLQAKPK